MEITTKGDGQSLLPSELVTLADIQKAHKTISPYIHRTPLLTSKTLDKVATEVIFERKQTKRNHPKVRLAFKAENFQVIGAFKSRGATNAVLTHLERLRNEFGHDFPSTRLSVLTHSSGNHAAALACAAQKVGARAVVVMPKTAPQIKKSAVAGYGARIVECEPTQAARESTAAALKEELEKDGKGTIVRFVHPYDEELVIGGQGTLGIELLEQTRNLEQSSGNHRGSHNAGGTEDCFANGWITRSKEEAPPLDIVIGPIGGGGMLSGLSTAIKNLDNRVMVIGAEPKEADDAQKSFKTGQLQSAVSPPNTICDGLLTSLSPRTLQHIQNYVSDIYLASEKAIVQSLRLVWERMKVIIEPSAAVGLAVVLENNELHKRIQKVQSESHQEEIRIGVIWTGGNVELEKIIDSFSRFDSFSSSNA